MLQFGVDFEDRLERQTGVAVLVVIERVDLVMTNAYVFVSFSLASLQFRRALG
jgi:hypothetical protein